MISPPSLPASSIFQFQCLSTGYFHLFGLVWRDLMLKSVIIVGLYLSIFSALGR